MKTKYYMTTTERPTLLKNVGVMYRYEKNTDKWKESESWFNRIIFSDYTDYKEISEQEALKIIEGYKKEA